MAHLPSLREEDDGDDGSASGDEAASQHSSRVGPAARPLVVGVRDMVQRAAAAAARTGSAPVARHLPGSSLALTHPLLTSNTSYDATDGGKEHLLALWQALQTSPSETADAALDAANASTLLLFMQDWWRAPRPHDMSVLDWGALRLGVLAEWRGGALSLNELALAEVNHAGALQRVLLALVRVGAMGALVGDMASDGLGAPLSAVAVEEALRAAADTVLSRVRRATRMLEATLVEMVGAESVGRSPEDTLPDVPQLFADVDSMSDKEKLVVYVYESMRFRNLRRRGDAVFEEVRIPRVTTRAGVTHYNVGTHAWVKKMSIQDYVYYVCGRSLSQMAFRTLVEKNFVPQVVALLTHGSDPAFPDVRTDTAWHAWEDGLLHTATGAFYDWDALAAADADASAPCPARKAVACVYHAGHHFGAWADAVGSWDAASRSRLTAADMPRLVAAIMAIPTPAFDTIILHQLVHRADVPTRGVALAIVFALVALYGRILQPVGALDIWQVAPVHIGPGGVGKSCIAATLALFFGAELTGILSNNTQAQFGLAGMLGKAVCLVTEMKGDFALPMSQYQSMVAGEDVEVTVKGKDSVAVKPWTAAWVLFGNATGFTADLQNALFRRNVYVLMNEPVDARKSRGLEAEMQAQLAPFFAKCMYAYLLLSAVHGKRSIWYRDDATGGVSVLPDYFHACRASMKAQTSPLVDFIENSGAIELDAADAVMPATVFQKLADDYFVAQNMPKQRWAAARDNVRFMLGERGVRVAVLTHEAVEALSVPTFRGPDGADVALRAGDRVMIHVALPGDVAIAPTLPHDLVERLVDAPLRTHTAAATTTAAPARPPAASLARVDDVPGPAGPARVEGSIMEGGDLGVGVQAVDGMAAAMGGSGGSDDPATSLWHALTHLEAAVPLSTVRTTAQRLQAAPVSRMDVRDDAAMLDDGTGLDAVLAGMSVSEDAWTFVDAAGAAAAAVVPPVFGDTSSQVAQPW